ncbi:MAG: aminotransferase class III-fold pyridoxal phosphate-dependent enzyme, partial [Pontibacter sp.]|nr:aminotransferase class III-fold pyridoxal phosphate-dependent enzyme [Pontibacter sp.]
FGGNYLACVASLAVLEVIEKENLMQNAQNIGNWLMDVLRQMPGVKEVRGKGLMIGVELQQACAPIRKLLLEEYGIFTGSSSDKNTLRLLPPLNIGAREVQKFLHAFEEVLLKAELQTV